MLKLYVDAGTQNNGRKGYQKTRIAVSDEDGKILVDKYLGDYTNNEGELLAILYALKNIEPMEQKTIYSDSRIATNWALRADKVRARQERIKKKNRLSDRHMKFINFTYTLLHMSDSTVINIPREENKAGWYLEEKYCI